MSINRRIKEYRLRQKMTQSDFAKSINIKQATLSQIENGKIQPSLNVIQTISKQHQVSYKYLIDGDNDYTKYKYNIGNNNKSNIVIDIGNKVDMLRKLYQRIIDVHLLIGKLSDNGVESKLKGGIDDFAKRQNLYMNDLHYSETGKELYKYTERPIDLKKLDKEELNSYNKKLEDEVSYFLNTFFQLFSDFYKEYMKDWYNKGSSQ